jgi:uncharacterized phage protein (TIGR02218 family)
MRHASAGLITFLNGLGPTSQPLIADLLTIILAGGTTYRFTSAPTNINSTSQAAGPSDPTVYTFTSGGVTFTRGLTKIIVGLQVDDLALTLLTSPTRDTLGGIPWPAAARNGALDGARIVLERAFMPTWNDTSAGTLILFAGTVGPIQCTRSQIAVTVKSNINVLSNPMPRNTYQPGCIHTLYDAGCTLLQATFTVTNAAIAGSTASLVKSTLAAASAYYDQGVITFTSGVNNGLSRPVTSYSHTNGAVSVAPPFPAVPGVGDTFSIYPGCDKSQGTCSAKFANLAHFRGYPYIPVPETAA